MVTSVDIRSEESQAWMEEVRDVEWMINLALMWIAPDLHNMGAKSVAASKGNEAHAQGKATSSKAKSWPSVFTGISVIANRKTKAHQDKGSYDSAYDVLISGGSHSECQLEVEELGGKLEYGPGTLVVICGRFLTHKVEKWSGKDRLCYAHYFKDDVHHAHGCKRGDWVNVEDFKKYMGKAFRDRLKGSGI